MATKVRGVRLKKQWGYEQVKMAGVMSSTSKRGVACGGGSPVCECSTNRIDCSNRGLVLLPIFPESFSEIGTSSRRRNLFNRKLNTPLN